MTAVGPQYSLFGGVPPDEADGPSSAGGGQGPESGADGSAQLLLARGRAHLQVTTPAGARRPPLRLGLAAASLEVPGNLEAWVVAGGPPPDPELRADLEEERDGSGEALLRWVGEVTPG